MGPIGRTHSAPYRGYGYVPLRFGGGGDVVRRMGTQQQRMGPTLVRCIFTILFKDSHFSCQIKSNGPNKF